MKATIIRACDMIAVPRKLLFDPKLSLSAKGVAGALLTFNDGDCNTAELAELSGISEKKLITYLDELVARSYPCNPSTFREKYKEALASIPGVRYLSPHSCRHTYVSQMQALGVDLATIQSLVGHADVDMTKHYLHVQDPIRIAAITKFDRAFSEEPETHSNIIDFMKSS